MNRFFYLMGLLLAPGLIAHAQIGLGGPAHPSAVIDLKSPNNNKGFLLPRLTTAQRKAVPGPAVGLLVFDLDKSTIFLYDGQNWVPLATTDTALLAPETRTVDDGVAGDNLGATVAISGDYALVGAPTAEVSVHADQGAAYVFARINGVWTQQARLTASDGTAGDRFGSSVSLSGDFAVIGAPNHETTAGGNADQGSAYVFERSGTGWTQRARLTASDGVGGDKFGSSVAISGDDVIVGAPFDDANFGADQGSAYVFTRFSLNWNQQAKLTASDAASGDNFGNSVALSGNVALVGAAAQSSGRGAAYGFSRSGSSWNTGTKIQASNGVGGDQFGYSVALSGSLAIIGAPYRDVNTNVDQGVAYHFINSGSGWYQQNMLVASDGAADDRFGSQVSCSGDYALIGAPSDDINANTDQGSAYAFLRNTVTNTWNQIRKITDSPTASTRLGTAVGIDNGFVIVGEPGFDNDRGKLVFSSLN